MTTAVPHRIVPDAVAALVTAVVQAHPHAEPERLGRLVQAELEAQGWHVGAPGLCRPVRRSG